MPCINNSIHKIIWGNFNLQIFMKWRSLCGKLITLSGRSLKIQQSAKGNNKCSPLMTAPALPQTKLCLHEVLLQSSDKLATVNIETAIRIHQCHVWSYKSTKSDGFPYNNGYLSSLAPIFSALFLRVCVIPMSGSFLIFSATCSLIFCLLT